jgi:hypothetical protein
MAADFHIAFNPRHLPGKADVGTRAQAHLRVQQGGRIDECVAMNAAKPRKAGVLCKPGIILKTAVCAPYFILV